MSSPKPHITILLLFLLLLPSCSKNFDNVEGYVTQYRTRPHDYAPADFAKQPNIVIMGDGYRSSDFGAFEAAAKDLVDHLFSVSPFSVDPFSKYFNVYFIYLNSQERGIGNGKAKNTALRCYFYNDVEIFFDDVNTFGGRKAPNPFDIVEQFVPGIDLGNTVTVILANDSKAVFTTGFRNVAPFKEWISIITVPPEPVDFKRLVLREIGGKAFARLAQEDDYFGTQAKAKMKELFSLYGFYANIDFTDDPLQVKWNHFFPHDDIYSELGIFHTGNGVYRPDNDNVMLYSGALHYDAPSREAIIKRIYQIHQWDYTEESFLQYFVTEPI